MTYTKNLSRLNDITSMKIAKSMSEVDNLKYQVLQLEQLKNELIDEHGTKNKILLELIHAPVKNIPDYYKKRSEISCLSGQLLIVTSRINNINDDLEVLSSKILKLNEEMKILHRKKKKYSKLLSEGY